MGMKTVPATVLVRLSQRASVVINQELLKEITGEKLISAKTYLF